jgi:hypothetical protein
MSVVSDARGETLSTSGSVHDLAFVVKITVGPQQCNMETTSTNVIDAYVTTKGTLKR